MTSKILDLAINQNKSLAPSAFQIVPPPAEAGYAVNQLIQAAPPLDTNSIYCNLLQCSYFSQTSAVTIRKDDEELMGFVSGYLVPERTDTLFIWQVAVAESARGLSLGIKMMEDILARQPQVKYIETSITDDNAASQGMFKKLARQLGDAEINKTILFDKQNHFNGRHETEYLYRIGPFESSQ